MVIVEPKYQMNLGYIARVSKNFGVNRLYLVKPRADPRGTKAIMFAKHARDLLEKSVICKNLDEAIKDCSYVIGTTGVWEKAKNDFREGNMLEDVVKRVSRLKSKSVALVIGRDDTGLRNDEILKCDAVAFVPTNPSYPVLNISHALAIFLYELSKNKLSLSYEQSKAEMAQIKEMERLFYVFNKMMAKKQIRNKAAVARIFKRLIRSSGLNAREVHAMITALK